MTLVLLILILLTVLIPNPSDAILCAFIVKYGLTLVCAIANVVPSLCVLPISVRRVVLNMICPELQEDDVNVIFELNLSQS
jgi:hypothetical protein